MHIISLLVTSDPSLKTSLKQKIESSASQRKIWNKTPICGHICNLSNLTCVFPHIQSETSEFFFPQKYQSATTKYPWKLKKLFRPTICVLISTTDGDRYDEREQRRRLYLTETSTHWTTVWNCSYFHHWFSGERFPSAKNIYVTENWLLIEQVCGYQRCWCVMV